MVEIADAGQTDLLVGAIDLVAVDDKKMVGKLSAPLGKSVIVVLTGKDDHGNAISTRYVIDYHLHAHRSRTASTLRSRHGLLNFCLWACCGA